jgi:hypothetical protein
LGSSKALRRQGCCSSRRGSSSEVRKIGKLQATDNPATATYAHDSVAGVVGVACEDGEGAVDLLGEDGASELMGQGDGAERES